MSLELVHCGLTNAAMFTADGKVVQPAEAFYKRPVLVLRGSFRPVTNVTVDMLHCALAQFVQEPANQDEDILVVTEMTLNNLMEGDVIDNRDFLDRVDLLRHAGPARADLQLRRVLPPGQLPPAPHAEAHRPGDGRAHPARDLRGEVLHPPRRRHPRIVRPDVQERPEALRLPALDPRTGAIITATNLRVAPKLQHLYNYLVENQHIQPIRDFKPEYLRHLLARRLPPDERGRPDAGSTTCRPAWP